VDAQNGDLFGHIIAGHPKSTLAYMLSAETIFSQLERVFGVKFDLPTTGFPDTRSSTTSAPPILARLGEMAANRTDGNFQVQALPDSPLQPQRTTTLTITELELLLRRLGLKVPIPYFEAADVLNKPLDIGRCYLADILNSLIDGNSKKGGAYSSILTPGDVFNGDLAVVLPKLKPGSKPNEVADSLITKV
jgi:hypothetical protein